MSRKSDSTAKRNIFITVFASVLLVGVVVGMRTISKTGISFESKAAAVPLASVPADFNAVLTHLIFFPRDGQQYVGKRYFGTKANAKSTDRKVMKLWSGPWDCVSSAERMVVYHYYNGWDDFPGKIQELEKWRRDPGNVLMGLGWGGAVLKTTPPYYNCGWMSYAPVNTKPMPTIYSCTANTPTVGSGWTSLLPGSQLSTAKNSAVNSCVTDGDANHYGYETTAFREDFGAAYSAKRQAACYRVAHPIWGRLSNAYNICLDAPHVGRFDQRYANYVGGWSYGCEPLVYAWGYPENSTTNKAFRNGELRWADWKAIGGSGFVSPNNEGFWQQSCDNVWYGQNGYDGGGWIYSGVYQVGANFYEDKGDANTSPVVVSGLSPKPTPAPYSMSDTWYEPSCGFKGEEWCAAGTSCDTGWVGGPTEEVACPANMKVRNTGTYYSRWDGMKRYVGRTDCVAVGC